MIDLFRRVYAVPTAAPPTDDWCHLRVGGEIDTREIARLATTIGTWQDEVLVLFDASATTATTECANVANKNVCRAARGFRLRRQYRASIPLRTG